MTLLYYMICYNNHGIIISIENNLNKFKSELELTKSSLIRRNRDRKELGIHRIIQDTVRTRMDTGMTKEVFQHVANLLYSAWPFSEFEHSTQRLLECEPVVAHVAKIHRVYCGSLIVKDTKQISEKLGRLFMDFGW